MANGIDHPLTVYLRETDIVPALDGWLAEAFAPSRIEDSIAAMEAAQTSVDIENDALRRFLAECDRKLAQHRAALEAGADPSLVAKWTQDVQSERATATAKLAGADRAGGQRLSKKEIRDLVCGIGGLLAALRQADAKDKAEVYRQLGLRLTYDHNIRKVLVEVRPPLAISVAEPAAPDSHARGLGHREWLSID